MPPSQSPSTALAEHRPCTNGGSSRGSCSSSAISAPAPPTQASAARCGNRREPKLSCWTSSTLVSTLRPGPSGRIIRPAARRTVAAADVPLHNSDFEVSNSSDSVSPQQRRRGVRKSELSTVPHSTPCSWQGRFRSKAVSSSSPAASSERIRASRPPRCTTTTTSRCPFSRPRSPNARPATPASDSPIHASSPEVRKVESSVANMQRVKKSRET